MKYFYDTEFVEDGVTIDLVSIGIVKEDGNMYYAVSSEFNQEKFMARPWMMENVWPSLPQRAGLLDLGHHAVKTRAKIRDDVYTFLKEGGSPELWAWYGSYDHVALAQLFGTMMDFPAGIPMWTNDLRQEVHRLDCMDKLPEQAAGKHNALEDALHLYENWKIVQALEGSRPYFA